MVQQILILIILQMLIIQAYMLFVNAIKGGIINEK